MSQHKDGVIPNTELVGTPEEALEVLRKVPESKRVDRSVYERAIEILSEFVRDQNSRATTWT